MELSSEEKKKFNIAAELVKIFHISIIIYMTFGWMINNPSVWLSIIIATPLFHIHWKTNKGKCFLTNLEKKLRKDIKDEGTFIGSLSKNIFKIEITDLCVSKLAYGIMYSSAAICLIRYVSQM